MNAQDTGAFWVDREDRAPKWIADEIPQNCAPNSAFTFGCTNNGDIARGKDEIKGMAAKGGGYLGWHLLIWHFCSLLLPNDCMVKPCPLLPANHWYSH